MENFNTIRQQVRQKREAFARADQHYYAALQAWSLGQRGISTGQGPVPGPEEVNQQKSASQQLQEARSAFDALAAPQQLIGELTSSLPFLLLPLRVEARYLTFRHVVRHLKSADALEAGNHALLNRLYQRQGFQHNEAGVMTYQVPVLTPALCARLLRFGRRGELGNLEVLTPPSGRFIQKKDDRQELRRRFYPDEVYWESLERALQPEEWQAGEHF